MSILDKKLNYDAVSNDTWTDEFVRSVVTKKIVTKFPGYFFDLDTFFDMWKVRYYTALAADVLGMSAEIVTHRELENILEGHEDREDILQKALGDLTSLKQFLINGDEIAFHFQNIEADLNMVKTLFMPFESFVRIIVSSSTKYGKKGFKLTKNGLIDIDTGVVFSLIFASFKKFLIKHGIMMAVDDRSTPEYFCERIILNTEYIHIDSTTDEFEIRKEQLPKSVLAAMFQQMCGLDDRMSWNMHGFGTYSVVYESEDGDRYDHLFTPYLPCGHPNNVKQHLELYEIRNLVVKNSLSQNDKKMNLDIIINAVELVGKSIVLSELTEYEFMRLRSTMVINGLDLVPFFSLDSCFIVGKSKQGSIISSLKYADLVYYEQALLSAWYMIVLNDFLDVYGKTDGGYESFILGLGLNGEWEKRLIKAYNHIKNVSADIVVEYTTAKKTENLDLLQEERCILVDQDERGDEHEDLLRESSSSVEEVNYNNEMVYTAVTPLAQGLNKNITYDDFLMELSELCTLNKVNKSYLMAGLRFVANADDVGFTEISDDHNAVMQWILSLNDDRLKMTSGLIEQVSSPFEWPNSLVDFIRMLKKSGLDKSLKVVALSQLAEGLFKYKQNERIFVILYSLSYECLAEELEYYWIVYDDGTFVDEMANVFIKIKKKNDLDYGD